MDHILYNSQFNTNLNWQQSGFYFQVIDNPNDVYEIIKTMNNKGFNSRMLAGYACQWTKEGNNDANVDDVYIPDFNFKMPWNSRSTTIWADDPGGIKQIGCIHTSQGLEFDFVGIIVGKI